MNIWDKNLGYKGPLVPLLENLFEKYFPKKESIENAHSWLINQINSQKGPFPIRHIKNCINKNISLYPKVNYFEKNDFPDLPFDIIASDNEACASFFAYLRSGDKKLFNGTVLDALKMKYISIGLFKNTTEKSKELFRKNNIPASMNNHSLKVSEDNLELCHITNAGDFEIETIQKTMHFSDEINLRICRLLSPINVFPFPYHQKYYLKLNCKGLEKLENINNLGEEKLIKMLFSYIINKQHPDLTIQWNDLTKPFFNAEESNAAFEKLKEASISIIPKNSNVQIINTDKNFGGNTQIPNDFSKSLTIQKTRFYVNQKIFDELSKGEYDSLIINVVLGNAKRNHPVGQYVIPRDVIINFIENKKTSGKNWKKNNNFHSVSIPSELSDYFNKKN